MSTWRNARRPEGADPRHVGSSLDGIARKLAGPGGAGFAAVFTRWEEIAGADLVAHAQPVSLNHGVLVLATDQPAWATQLRYLSAHLLDRLVAVGIDGVSRIEVKVGPGTGAGNSTRFRVTRGPG